MAGRWRGSASRERDLLRLGPGKQRYQVTSEVTETILFIVYKWGGWGPSTETFPRDLSGAAGGRRTKLWKEQETCLRSKHPEAQGSHLPRPGCPPLWLSCEWDSKAYIYILNPMEHQPSGIHKTMRWACPCSILSHWAMQISWNGFSF